MSKQTEALKLALEYMNEYYPSYAKQAAHHHRVSTALREALAEQPAQQQEPVISTAHGPWIPSTHPGEEGESYCKRCLLRDKFLGSRLCEPHIVEQPAQTDWEAVAADQAMTIALLRAEQPAQRTWIGLTDEEVTWLCDTAKSHEQTWGMFVRTIEAKLKEKNT